MQLATRDGIQCDKCGVAIRTDFTYYSCDFRKVESKLPLDRIFRLPIIQSFDYCGQCYAAITALVVQRWAVAAAASGTRCEWTGAAITGVYYYGSFTMVAVRLSGQAAVCSQCRAVQAVERCACGNATFVRPASTTVTDRVVEVDFSEAAYCQFVDISLAMRQRTNEWTTKDGN